MGLLLADRRARYEQCFGLLLTLAGLRCEGAVDQLDHSLQCATRALDAGARPDLVFGALMHDLYRPGPGGFHGLAAARLIQPLVSDATYWTVRIHDHLMLRHVPPAPGLVSEAPRYRDEAWFPLALVFCDEWDRPAFAPGGRAFPPAYFHSLLYHACVRPGQP